ncbi:MAG TPA: lysophospholipid acyltransferase family protein [Kofleriaceae bacterium]|nr:lysophospholipid acyltransferase family protein [Kofleriaceae bacterium]
MPKQILGDNPFDDDDGEGDGEKAPTNGANTSHARPAIEVDAVDTGFAREARADTAVPDAIDESHGELSDLGDEVFLGGEAAVPPHEYGPPIPSVLPDPSARTSELRELERRARALLTPAFPIEHRRRLPLEMVWRRYRKVAMQGRSEVVDDYGRDPVQSSRIEPLIDLLYRRYFRVSVTGIDNIPGAGRALVVANHSGILPYDGALLMHAVKKEHPARRELRPLIEDLVFHFPYLGVFMNRIGGVRACQENAQRLLEQDQLVAVFPEGEKGVGKLYRERYKLQRFGRGGFIKLALRTRTPVVPVAIVGAEEAHPMMAKVTWLARAMGLPFLPITPTFPLLGPLGLLPLPAKWKITVGEPMDIAGEHGPEAAADRVLVAHLAESVRGRIQRMIDDTVSERRSVVFG